MIDEDSGGPSPATDEAGVQVHDLVERWPASAGEPNPFPLGADAGVEAGTYVVEPGERVPPTGTTAHRGTEVSVVLSGELVLDGPSIQPELTVGPETAVVIPAGIEHHSRNPTDTSARLVYVVHGEV